MGDMAKLVFKKLGGATSRKVHIKKVREKKIKAPDGVKVVLMIDSNSDTLNQDLTYAFGRNVARARRENKRLTGALDRVPHKG